MILYFYSFNLCSFISFSGPTQSYTIPLKNCQGSVIDHNLVSIRLNVEWPDKAGDNPNLVIHVTNKRKEKYFFFFSF